MKTLKTMKTTISKSTYFLLALLIAFSFSCSPEDGNDGAAGPAGTNGSNGADGTDGEDGNANVISSDWFEPVESDFSVSNSDYKALPLPLQNYDANKDVLLIYYYNQNENNTSYTYIHMLPYYRYDINGENLDKSITVDIRPTFSTVYVKIESYGRDLLPREYLWEPDPSNLDNKGVRFRYMIIPGNTTKLSSNKSTLKPFESIKHELSTSGVNINDYYAVCDYYGIAY